MQKYKQPIKKSTRLSLEDKAMIEISWIYYKKKLRSYSNILVYNNRKKHRGITNIEKLKEAVKLWSLNSKKN